MLSAVTFLGGQFTYVEFEYVAATSAAVSYLVLATNGSFLLILCFFTGRTLRDSLRQEKAKTSTNFGELLELHGAVSGEQYSSHCLAHKVWSSLGYVQGAPSGASTVL